MHAQGADGIQNGQDHHAHIGEDGEPHIRNADSAQRQAGKLPLAEIAAKVGYTSQSKFAAAFKEEYSMLPKEYRKQAAARGGGNGEIFEIKRKL